MKIEDAYLERVNGEYDPKLQTATLMNIAYTES